MGVRDAKLERGAGKGAAGFIKKTCAHTRDTGRLLPAQKAVHRPTQRAQDPHIEAASNAPIQEAFDKSIAM